MIVTLDGKKLDQSFSEQTSLRSLVDAVREGLPEDRMIVALSLNGQEMPEGDLEQCLRALAQPNDQIDLESADKWELSASALRSVADELENAAEKQSAIAEKLTSGDSSEAIREVGEFVLLWQTCQKTVIQCCDVARTNLTERDFDGRPVSDHLSDLADRLREIRDALEARDYVLLADVVRYEIPNLCTLWRDILMDMATAVSEMAATPDA